MATGRFVSYLRVSTARQGRSGLGLEAQRSAVADYLNGGNWRLVAEVVEVESGANDARPKLAEALALCRSHRGTLVIAKLDRLARDAHFLLGLEKAGIEFVASDMPSANRMTVGIMAVIAEEERRMIAKRTKDALAAAKKRGKKLGGIRPRQVCTAGTAAVARAERTRQAMQRAADMAPLLERLNPSGNLSLRALAEKLTNEGVPTPGNATVWTAATVARMRHRLKAAGSDAAVRPQ
jgi:DNA invertase Pin-like site-specific DNA recombinase